jgi:Probable cobalt transporter subunit (CbtB)
MAAPTAAVPQVTVPIPRWGWALFVAAVGVLYLVTFEGGVVSEAVGQAGSFFHELFHDGRHLLGVPCH